MDKKKLIQIFYFTLFLLVLFSIYFSYNKFNTPVQKKEIKDSPFSILLKNATDTFTESTEWYETSIHYPKNNTKIRDQIFQLYADFSKETEIKKYTNLAEAKEGLQINVEGLKYSFTADFKIATSTNSITYIYQIYTFTGGAHGATQIFPITENEKQEIVTASQILPDDKLLKVSKLAESNIRIQKKERMKSFGMSDKDITESLKSDTFIKEGTKPIRENYNSVWLEGDNLVISFGQYQVGPYAEGIYEVKLSKESVI